MKTRYLYLVVLFLISSILFSINISYAQTDVSSLVQINESRMMYDRRTGQFSYTVSLTNTSAELILSPVKVVIDSINSTMVTVANADGMTAGGKPYFLYEGEFGDGNFEPGETSGLKKWAFNNPRRLRFNYATSVLGDVADAFGSIGPEGGMVEVTDPANPLFGTKLQIPEGAINDEVIITINVPLVSPPIPDGFTAGSNLIELQPSGLSFSEEVKLIISSDNVSPGDFYVYDESENIWLPIRDTWFNSDTNNFEIELDHFSVYGFFHNIFCVLGGNQLYPWDCKRFDECSQVTYYINPSADNISSDYTNEQIKNAIKDALSTWQFALGNVLQFVESNNYPSDINFYWSKASRLGTKIAQTFSSMSGNYMYIRFNDRGSSTWVGDIDPLDLSGQKTRVEDVALHELGHVLGLRSHYRLANGDKCTSCDLYSGGSMQRPLMCDYYYNQQPCDNLKTDAIDRLKNIYDVDNATCGGAEFSDDFEDGVIDASKWVTNGRRAGIGGPGAGSWQWSFNEVTGSDGYLEARIWGPHTGNTFWGESRLRTVQDFNDGNSWLINFTWETLVPTALHVDGFTVEITAGGFPNNNHLTWIWTELPLGTYNLWFNISHLGAPPALLLPPNPPFSKRTWSILINPNGTASLYHAPNAGGPMISQTSLDTSREWFVRFVNVDGTSGGFGAGENRFRLYDFSATTQ